MPWMVITRSWAFLQSAQRENADRLHVSFSYDYFMRRNTTVFWMWDTREDFPLDVVRHKKNFDNIQNFWCQKFFWSTPLLTMAYPVSVYVSGSQVRHLCTLFFSDKEFILMLLVTICLQWYLILLLLCI